MQLGQNPETNIHKSNLHPVPKPKHQRRVPKREERGKFTPSVCEEIIERDEGLCIRCKKPAIHIHHITYRSQLGNGSKRNGVCVCYICHEWSHRKREGREWFEQWRENNLDGLGNLKEVNDD